MNTNDKKRAVIYCRVSTKEQVEEGNSLVSQEKICKDYATKHNYEIVRVFIEQGESAKNADRTELKKLIGYCTDKKNKIEIAIAYKIDRVARNIDDYRFIRTKLKEYGVEIKSTSEFFEDTPTGRFMENIIANVAQFDNEIRTERSMNGMRDAIIEGRYVWAAPIGYNNAKIEGKSNIIPNEMASLIKELFWEVAENKFTVDTTWKRFIERGLVTRNGKKMERSYTYMLLRNELYCGWINKFGERYKGSFEPLISEELFIVVQHILRKRGRKFRTYKRENEDFPLRRFVFHRDGEKLTGSWSKGRKKLYPYYRFIQNKTHIGKEDFEKSCSQFFDKLKLDSCQIDNLHVFLEKTFQKENITETTKPSNSKDELDALNKKAGFLLDKNEKGILSDVMLKKHLDEIELRIAELQLTNIEPDISLKEIDINELFQFSNGFLQNPGIVWLESSFKQKIDLQWFVFPKGLIFENGNLRTTEVANIFKVKEGFLHDLSIRVPLKNQDNQQRISTNQQPENVSHVEPERILKDIITLARILKGDKPP